MEPVMPWIANVLQSHRIQIKCTAKIVEHRNNENKEQPESDREKTKKYA